MIFLKGDGSGGDGFLRLLHAVLVDAQAADPRVYPLRTIL